MSVENSAMSKSSVVLITGPNRGIGRKLLECFLGRANHIVIAGVRDVSSATSKSLLAITPGPASSLIMVKIDSDRDNDPSAAMHELKTIHGVKHLDVVVANAGIAKYYGPVLTTPLYELRDHLNINTLAPLALFQATAPLLQASADPKFFVMSSNIGSLGMMEHLPMPGLAYGCSKAAVNYLSRKIHFECPWLSAVALSPGWVQTDMGQNAADALGISSAPVTIDESVQGLLKQIDLASRDTISGMFASFDDKPLMW